MLLAKKKAIQAFRGRLAPRIARLSTMIEPKTEGEKLALQACLSTSPMEGKGSKYMRFEHFINKMHELYLAEQQEQQKRKEIASNLMIAATLGNEPYMDTLKIFTDNLERGFQGGQHVGSIMKNLGRVANINGKAFYKFGDYNYLQTIKSFRFKLLLQEIEHGLTPEVFFAPLHMARVLEGMEMLQFKNTSCILKFFDKIKSQIDPVLREQTEAKMKAVPLEERLMDTVKGGKLKGRSPGYYLYEGFQTNEEFNDLLNILLEWQVQKKRQSFIKTPETEEMSQQDNREFNLIKGSLEQLSNVVVDSKRIQGQLLTSLNELKSQYYKIIERVDRQQFLLENPYIFYQILKVQDFLVKAGILKAENLYHAQEYFQNFEVRMRKSAEAFYEMTGTLIPQAISPQLDEFYDAVVQNSEKQHLLEVLREKTTIPLIEKHNEFNLQTLGRCLIAITNIAREEKLDLSVELNKGQLALLPKGKKENLMEHLGIKEDYELKQENDKFAPEYTTFWRNMQSQFESLIPSILLMTEQSEPDLLGAMLMAYALSNSGVGSQQLSDKLSSLLARSSNQQIEPRNRKRAQIWIQGIYGLVYSPCASKHKDIVIRVANEIWKYHQNDGAEGINLLSALRAAWALSAVGAYDEPAFMGMVRFLNEFPVGFAKNELTREELMLFKDLAMALEAKYPEFMSKEASSSFLEAAYNKEQNQEAKDEPEAIDPLHGRAVKGITKGLANAGHFSAEKQKLMEGLKKHEAGLIGDKFQLGKGYAPDIISGYKGNKVVGAAQPQGIFILRETECLKNTQQPNGIMLHRFKLLEQLDPLLKCVYIPLNAICSLDLENMGVHFNQDFNMFDFLDQQVQSNQVKLEPAVLFFRKVITTLKNETLLTDTEQTHLMNNIYSILKAKQACDALYVSEMRSSAISRLNVELMKLALFHRSLSPHKQAMLNELIDSDESVDQLLKKIAKNIKPDQQYEELSSQLKEIGSDWMGVRMGVELPPEGNPKKDISKELMNYGNMLVQDYFKYPDWEQKLDECYNKLNLMIKPPLKEPYLYSNNHRRVPNGVFPDPTAIMKNLEEPLHTNYPAEHKNAPTNVHSEFLKDPFQYMLKQDLAKPRKPVDNQAHLMTSLLNLRNTLKKNYSDAEILEKLLSMEFIEELMREHLRQLNGESGEGFKGKELPRDPKMYTRFCAEMKSVVNSQNDAFSDYFIKEAGRKEYQHILASRLKDKPDVQQSKVTQHLENYYLRLQTLDKDMYNVSHVRDVTTDVKYNLTSLFSNLNRRLLYEDFYTSGGAQQISDAGYLEMSRRIAETKLIKARLLWKLHEEQSLSMIEKKYLKKWVESIEKGAGDFNQIEMTMLAPHITRLTLGNLDSQDKKLLLRFNQVNLTDEAVRDFTLNELCLQLSHFINPATIKKVELEILGDKLRDEWGLPSNFQICDSRNFEVDLIIQEVQEKNWRESGRFDQNDYEGVRRMTSIDRGNGDIDRVFLPMDEKSLKEFMLYQCNEYEDRVDLLFQWLNRKENDINSRLRVPPRKYQKSDRQIYQTVKIDKSYQNILATVFRKKYNEIEGSDMHQMVMGICDRFSMFNGNYPQELIDLFQALWKHPSLFEEDRDRLNIFSDYFEFQWKNSDTQLLCMSPLFLEGSRTETVMDLGRTEERLKKAGVDFVTHLKEQMTTSE